jgi:hypothetical protein
VLIDAVGFVRSVTSLVDIAAVPRERLNYAQVCGASTSVEGLIHTAPCERLLPGWGGIAIVGFHAWQGRATIVLSL